MSELFKHYWLSVLLLVGSIICFASLFTGCRCWQAEHEQDAQCLVQHELVDCNVQAGEGLAPKLVAVVLSAIAGGSIDWNTVLQSVEGMGFADAGCILSVLTNAFVPKTAASGEQQKTYQAVSDRMLDWKRRHGFTGVRFCFADTRGKQVCH